MKGLTDLTASLRELTRKDSEFTWNESHTNAERAIHVKLSNAPELHYNYYDMAKSKSVTIQAGASQTGMGAALMQDGQPIPLQKYTIQIPLNTIEYHSVPLDHSMVFQHDSVVFAMVICNTIQYHWTIQWYFSRLNGTLGYSMVFLLDSMVLWMVIRNTIQDHWTIQWYILFSVVFSMVFQNTIEYHWTIQW